MAHGFPGNQVNMCDPHHVLCIYFCIVKTRMTEQFEDAFLMFSNQLVTANELLVMKMILYLYL